MEYYGNGTFNKNCQGLEEIGHIHAGYVYYLIYISVMKQFRSGYPPGSGSATAAAALLLEVALVVLLCAIERSHGLDEREDSPEHEPAR